MDYIDVFCKAGAVAARTMQPLFFPHFQKSRNWEQLAANTQINAKVLDLQITFKLLQKNDHFKTKTEQKPPEKHLIPKNYGNLII